MPVAKVALVNPNVVASLSDPFTTGIVYMPFGLAYAAQALRDDGAEVQVVDAFGAAPSECRREGGFLLQGLRPPEAAGRVAPGCRLIGLYAINLLSHRSMTAILAALKARRPAVPVAVLENAQAVTAYSLTAVSEELFKAGADYLVTGDLEPALRSLVRALNEGRDPGDIPGVWRRGKPAPPRARAADPSELPARAAWDLFPIEAYWSLRHAHGPFESDRYLPILTSRGCPYPCAFCVVPETNALKWRPRPAASVADEMEDYGRRFGVREFHVEDLDPTVSDARIRELCAEIGRRGLDVTWKLASGTKAETIKDEETLDRMASAGCRFISISPESGSARVLASMKKPFDREHALRLVRRMHGLGIRSQACFVLGFPGETDEDRAQSLDLGRELARAGLDEIALFIIAPVPGSALYGSGSLPGFQELSELHFSPSWRPDYTALNRFRLGFYARFLAWKLRWHPAKLLAQPWRFATRRFQTKMEMAPYRALSTALKARAAA